MEVQRIYGLPDSEEMSCGYDDTLSREDHRDSRLRDQTMVKLMSWDICRGCERKKMSTESWM